MSIHRTVRYPLEKFTGCMDDQGRKILAFSIRTTDGEDETYASKRAEAKGVGFLEELVRFSIVSYEVAGKVETVKHPFEAFDKWSTKARNFLVAGWKKLSSPDEHEFADFFGAATDVE